MEIAVPEDIKNMYRVYTREDKIPRSEATDTFMKSINDSCVSAYERGYKAGYMAWKDNKEDTRFISANLEFSNLIYDQSNQLNTVLDLYNLISDEYFDYIFEGVDNFDRNAFARLIMLFGDVFSKATQEIDTFSEKFNNFYSELRGKYYNEKNL